MLKSKIKIVIVAGLMTNLMTSLMIVSSQAVPLASQIIEGSMNVEKYAELSGLTDITLDKALEGSIVSNQFQSYSGSGPFSVAYHGEVDARIRSNCPISVSIGGDDLVNNADGVTTIPTRYHFIYPNSASLFGNGFDYGEFLSASHTWSSDLNSDVVDEIFTMKATAVSYDLASQKAGVYSGNIVVTISPI